MRKFLLILIIALAFFACDDKDDTHTHEWEWVVTTQATATTDGLETETCKTCGATNGTRPIAMLPQNQTATLTNLFGEGYTATVTGYFSNTEWAGVADKVKTLLNNAYNAGPAEGPMSAIHKGAYIFVFDNSLNDTVVTITVIKNPSFGKYQVVDGAFRELNLNYSALNTLTNADIHTAIEAMRDNTPATE